MKGPKWSLHFPLSIVCREMKAGAGKCAESKMNNSNENVRLFTKKDRCVNRSTTRIRKMSPSSVEGGGEGGDPSAGGQGVCEPCF